MDSYIINNNSISCYNMTYDSDANQYLRAQNRNTPSCDNLKAISFKIKNSYIKFIEVTKSYKCTKEDKIIEFGTNCISCSDKNIQEISINLEHSLIDLQKLQEHIENNNYDYNKFKELHSHAIENIVTLEFSLQKVDSEVLEAIFYKDFLCNNFLNNALKYITLGWYLTDSENIIEQITTNLNSITSNINYLDMHI